MFIENSDSQSPLIYGDFDVDSLQINGKLNINGAFNFPTSDGDSLQVLATDGNGTVNWNTIQSGIQTLTFENDTLTISDGNSVDLSGLREINSNGLSLVIDPTSILDIEQAETNVSASNTDSVWQSFIPNYSGYLSQVDFNLGSSPNFDGGYLHLYSGTGISGTLLHTISVSSLSSGWQSIDLINENIAITSGDTYTMMLADSLDTKYTIKLKTGDPYPDGTAGNGTSENTGWDVKFRTYYIRDTLLTTNILSVNTGTSDTITFNLSSLDTIHFNNGSFIASGGIIADVDSDTKIQVEESSDEDIIRFDLGGTEAIRFEANDNNVGRIYFNRGVSIGENAGYSSKIDTPNINIGQDAGYYNQGGFNTLIGYKTGFYNVSGIYNLILGAGAGFNSTGDYNVFLGNTAGFNNTGSNNVFIGKSAGFNEAGSDKLYIENSDTSSPLIYGEFDNDLVQVNGILSVTGGFVDSDNDTKIQVEESSDEDIIRFDLGRYGVSKIRQWSY